MLEEIISFLLDRVPFIRKMLQRSQQVTAGNRTRAESFLLGGFNAKGGLVPITDKKGVQGEGKSR